MVGQPWRHEAAAAKETSDDSDEIDLEVESDYEEKLFGLLQSGKHRVRNPDGTFHCPLCLGKKKQNYQLKDLLQHADGIGARHRAFARFVHTDPSFAHDHAIINDKSDAARVAYDILVERQESDDVNVTDELELTDQDVKFSKSILHNFAAKTAANQPCYTVFNPEVSSHRHLFVASMRFAGHTYTGEYATNKKYAEQKAARVVVKSILATKNTCMVQIIRSKKKLITSS
ncbi:hypothetical protein GUJ93_ZPchr0005g15322 [Zizania palustris]|uniref:DRBM domain-containing protein n=1 Tax=Zizania palustris TaxID=103762 RepID=A0A8J5VRZ7_ZIZPA|nr:hypothetical protein GUJ93_ZPchr0005g15322 [Zizania palustris]